MATKPTRLQAKQVFPYVNSTPVRRVQSFDFSSSFTTDSVYELGNAGIVEDSVTLVDSNITMNALEWGTTDAEAMIFGIFQQRNIRGDNATVGITNTVGTIYISTFGAGGDWRAYATVDSWLQITRLNANATTNDTEFVKIETIRYAAASLVNVIGLYAAYDLTAAPATGDIVSLVNAYTITQDTVDSDPVHFTVPHRYNTTATTVLHTVCLPRCSVDNLTYSFDTGGGSEQNYTLVGEEERLLLGSRREAKTITGSFMSYTNATVIFRVPLDSESVTGSPLYLYADSNLVNHSDYAIAKTGSCTLSARIGSGLSIDANTQLVYYYTNTTKKGYKGITNITNSIGKLTKGYVTVELQYSTGTIEQLQRCTGVNINVPLTRESIDELGESRSIAKPLEGNLRNEVTLTFNRNDLREYAKLLGQQEAFDAGTTTQILMTDLKSSKSTVIYVKFYASQTTQDVTTLLKTMTFEDCNFIGDNSPTPLTGASTLELNFSTQTVSIVGSGLPPIYV